MAIKSRKLTDDGDFAYSGGTQVMIEDEAALAQGIRNCLLTIRGEMILHPTIGIPTNAIDNSTTDTLKNAIQSAIMRSGRTNRIISIEEDGAQSKRRKRTFNVRVEYVNGSEQTLGVAFDG